MGARRGWPWIAAVVLACGQKSAAPSCPVPAAVGPAPGRPTKILQLLGDLDRETSPPTPTRTRTESTVGLVGTDLGFSFVHRGRLYFLFGDSIPVDESPTRPKDCDAIAWSDDFTSNPSADGGFALHFLTDPDGAFQPVRLDGRPLGTLELPTTGFSAGDRMYVFFVVGGRSVLATSTDDGKSFQTLIATPSSKMVNVMPVLDGSDVVLFGRRASDAIYLARVPLASIADASSWRFATGRDVTGAPTWSASDAEAAPVVDASCGCNGNLSVTYLAGVGRWLMLNRCDEPHAIFARTAPSLYAQWTDARVFFDRSADGGLCRFIHRGCDPAVGNCCDTNVQPAHDGQWGAGQDGYPYAPFPIAPYTQFDPSTRTTTLYFLMSVWNPYSPMLMKATLPESALR